jgi:hypothetical protein
MHMRRAYTWCALAGLVALMLTVAQEGRAGGGVPITTCNQTVTASAYLAENLTCPGVSGVVVGADGITIDLRGFTLRGDNSDGHYGIVVGTYAGAKIVNGTIRDFDFGIATTAQSTKLGITNVTSDGNWNGASIQGDGSSIKSSSFSGNGLYGIFDDGNAVSVSSVTADGNGSDGIQVDTGNSLKIKSVHASGNGNDGIELQGNFASITSSTASGNGFTGISVTGDGAQIKGNRTEGNGFGDHDGFGIGVFATAYSTAPVGPNNSRGNDDPMECNPATLC